MEKDINNIEDKLSLANYIKTLFDLPDTDIKSYSPLTLAYIGDSVYDLLIKTTIIWQGNAPVNKLHKKAASVVKATAQAKHYHMIEDILSEEESVVYKRGRNAKSVTSAKNTGIVDYRTATGLEALIGYLYLLDRTERIMEIMKPVIQHTVSIS